MRCFKKKKKVTKYTNLEDETTKGVKKEPKGFQHKDGVVKGYFRKIERKLAHIANKIFKSYRYQRSDITQFCTHHQVYEHATEECKSNNKHPQEREVPISLGVKRKHKE